MQNWVVPLLLRILRIQSREGCRRNFSPFREDKAASGCTPRPKERRGGRTRRLGRRQHGGGERVASYFSASPTELSSREYIDASRAHRPVYNIPAESALVYSVSRAHRDSRFTRAEPRNLARRCLGTVDAATLVGGAKTATVDGLFLRPFHEERKGANSQHAGVARRSERTTTSLPQPPPADIVLPVLRRDAQSAADSRPCHAVPGVALPELRRIELPVAGLAAGLVGWSRDRERLGSTVRSPTTDPRSRAPRFPPNPKRPGSRRECTMGRARSAQLS